MIQLMSIVWTSSMSASEAGFLNLTKSHFSSQPSPRFIPRPIRDTHLGQITVTYCSSQSYPSVFTICHLILHTPTGMTRKLYVIKLGKLLKRQDDPTLCQIVCRVQWPWKYWDLSTTLIKFTNGGNQDRGRNVDKWIKTPLSHAFFS